MYLNFSIYTVFLKNRKIIFKMKISKVTDYAALNPPVKYFTDRSFFCGSFMFFCLVFAMSLCASVYMCFVVTSWEKADLLALVCGV